MSAVSTEDSRADLLLSGEAVAFGKYWLTRLIARGGMGEVYLARLVGEFGFEKRLVIKTILPHLAEKPRFVELFAAEAKTAVALSHGNIVPIYELGRTGDTFYIVMGHVDGPSVAVLLDAYRREQRVADLAVGLHIVRGVLTGLAYAHTPEPGRGAVVHRDITPRNILIDRSGQVRIVDFGIAAPADIEVDVRAGSTGYAAPEQIRSGTVDPRADVFSAAALLYELVTLERAFPKEGVWSPPDFSVLPDLLRPPIEAALAIDPMRRPMDAGAMLDQLAPAFARYAATFGDAQLSAHLRELFVDGWDEHSKPAIAGEVPARAKAKSRPDTQTFATRLTLVTKLPYGSATRTGSASPVRRRWPLVAAALAVGSVVTWGALAASRADPPAPAVAQPGAAPAPTPVATPPAREPAADHSESPPEIASPKPELPAPVEPVANETAGDAPAPASMHLSLEVEPRDATVSVDGKKVDPSGFDIAHDTPVSIVVRKEGFATRSIKVDAEHRPPAKVVLAALEEGFLEVVAPGVAWAAVTVGGKNVGHTPLRKLALMEGKHRVVVKCAAIVCGTERTMLTKTVVVKPGQLTKLQAE